MSTKIDNNTDNEAPHVAPQILRMIVIYHHARDYPQFNFVARQWFQIAGKTWTTRRLYASGATLREVRATVPGWMSCIPRQPGEDEVIVETWV